MFSLVCYARNKIVETFEGSGKFDRDESSPNTKKMELQLTKNLEESKPSARGMMKPVYDDRCCRCLLDSSPVVITNRCLHKFCVKCILYLWSRQKIRKPCICPLDGQEMTYLRSPTISQPQPEEITSLVKVYNPLFTPTIKSVPDMSQRRLELTLSRLSCVDMAFVITGAIAYCLKLRHDQRQI